MKGLLIKDFRLLKSQKQFLFSVFAISIIFVVTGQNMGFMIGYLTGIISFFSLGTVSYDEHNNGFFYLFTMPISRRLYAVEKYLFGLLTGGGAWIFATVAAGIITWMKNPGMNMTEWIVTAVVEFLAIQGMVAILIPIHLKFGAEKSRIATMATSLVIFGGILLIAKIAKSTNVHLDFGWIMEISVMGWCAIGLAAFAAVMLISMAVSIHVMEHKKF